MCFVCLDGYAARREQMVDTGQPVGEQQADRKGKSCLSSAPAWALNAKTAHLRAP